MGIKCLVFATHITDEANLTARVAGGGTFTHSLYVSVRPIKAHQQRY